MTARDKWERWKIPLLTIGVCLNFVGLALALNYVRLQSNEGFKARQVQCSNYPITVKLYEAAYKIHWISLEDLRVIRDNRPKNCPEG